MRPLLRLLVLTACAPLVTACPTTPPEGGEESSSTGAGASTSEPSPTEGMTGIMTTDGPTEGATTTPASTTSTTTTTNGTDPSTGETGETTGDLPGVIVDGLLHPESILVDEADGVYLISNINGDPAADDGDGFITRVMPDGTMVDLKWIDGEGGEVMLSAPKGMGIHEDLLYVADITRVHKFDRVSGALLATIPVGGAMLLNDVVVNSFGRVYVSDTMTNKIHLVDTDDTVSEFLAESEIQGANGLLLTGDVLLAVGYNAGDLFQIPVEGAVPELVHTFEAGGLDGIAAVADGFLVSSWDAKAVYKIAVDYSAAAPVLEDVQSPADIAYDAVTGQLLIPQLELDRAWFYPL